MAIGKRIRFFRNRKGMTQKQLGEILGFLGKTSDVRMAQYETEARTPKHDLVKEMANLFDVSTHALTVPDIDTYIGLMHTLFALEDMYGLKIGKIDGELCLRLDKSDYSNYTSMFNMLHAWQEQAAKLEQGEITKEEYRRLKGKIAEQIQQLEANISYLKEEMQVMADGIGTDDPYLTAFLKHKNIQSLNRGIMVELVKAVWVHENGEITVDFNFADEYQRIIDYIENNHNVIQVIESKAI